MPARLTAFLPDAAASCLVRSLAPLGIGRGAESGFRIDHPSISRKHARLVWERDRWNLHDEGSKNGSFVDGERVHDWRYMHRMNLRALPSLRARLNWLVRKSFPNLQLMREMYGRDKSVPALWAARARQLMRKAR